MVENVISKNSSIDAIDKQSDQVLNNIENPVINYLDPKILDVKVVDSENIESLKDSDNDIDINFVDYKESQVVEGTIVSVSEREVMIDIGFKAEGVVPLTEFKSTPVIGDAAEVLIVTFEDKKGNIILSKEKADFTKRWKELRDCYANGDLIDGKILKRIKGGMVVDLGVVQAFLPGSQVDISTITNFDDFVGMDSEFKIVKFNELRQNVVVSRKAILEKELIGKKEEIISQMEIGMVLEGIVKNITDFGVFVDLGGMDGLLHITDITWGRINHPSEKLEINQKIKVKVIDFDQEKMRVSLGMKQLEAEPWENVDSRYPVGNTVKGKVVNIMNYGAFVEIEDGVEGLIHISEMSWIRHIKHPSDLFKLGDEVEAKILNIDKDDRKISLGIKQLSDNPWDKIESKYPIGSIHDGKVNNLTQFGAFIELEPGIDGLLHISDLSWMKKINHPNEMLSKNDEIKVKVLEVSNEDRKLSLGLKQLEEDPWENIDEKYKTEDKVMCLVQDSSDKGIKVLVDKEFEGFISFKSLSKSDKKVVQKQIADIKEIDCRIEKIDFESKLFLLTKDFELEDKESE